MLHDRANNLASTVAFASPALHFLHNRIGNGFVVVGSQLMSEPQRVCDQPDCAAATICVTPRTVSQWVTS